MQAARVLAMAGGAIAQFTSLAAIAGEGDSGAPIVFSGEAALVSNYVYRGVSFSDGGPAIQASVEWAATIGGLHGGVWASSIDFGADDPATMELSAFAAYGGSAGGVTYDAGVAFITYPGVRGSLNYDYLETYVSLGAEVGAASLTAIATLAPDYSGATGQAWFIELDGEMPVAERVNLTAAVGYAALPTAAGKNNLFWQIGAAIPWWGFNVALQYHGNDLGKNDGLVVKLARSF